MKFLDFFRMGLVNLSRRKARTILTALSMAIGVMCIVVLISVGLGYEAAYRENIEAMGSLTKIDVTPPSDSTGGRTALLNDKAVDAFKKLRGVEAGDAGRAGRRRGCNPVLHRFCKTITALIFPRRRAFSSTP